MESKMNKKNLGQFSKQFAKLARKASSCERLYFVTGARQAGKSVFVGLMCGRDLTLIQDTQTMINIIVESQNKLHQYSPIHWDSQNNVAAIQSFLLEQDSQETPIQIAKLAMLQAILPIVKQISFALIIDDSQKQSALYHIDIFLKLLGITQNQVSPAISIIMPFTYLIITKVEDSLESCIELFEQLINQTENKNVYELLRFMIDSNHISVIPLSAPDSALGQNMRNFLVLHKYQPKSLIGLLSNSALRKDELPIDSTGNILLHLEKIVVLIINMVIYGGGDKKGKQSYEKIAKEIYTDSKNKNKIDMMLGNWTKNNFDSTNLSGLSSRNEFEQLKSLLDAISAILASIQIYSPTAKEDLREIKSEISYYCSLLHWFTNYTAPAWVQQNANKLLACFNPTSSPEVEVKPQIESKIVKSKALGQFCKGLQMCKSNGDVIRQCTQRLRQKKDTSLAPFQWRIIRDLLQDCQNSLNVNFLPQLIDFSIFTNDDYHCQLYIKKALWCRVLTEQQIYSLIKILHNHRPALCELLVDYVLGVTNSKQIFDNFIRLKGSLKMKSHQLFLDRLKQQGQFNNLISQNYQLLTTYNKIVEKYRENAKFSKFLQGKDYQQYLTPLQ